MDKDQVIEIVAGALDGADLDTAISVIERAQKGIREDIERCRQLIVQTERWERVPVVLSDLDPERREMTHDQEKERLSRWHGSLMKQIRFVLKFGNLLRSMQSERDAPLMVAAILEASKRKVK